MTTTALEIAQQALRDILDPIGYMERGLEEGYRLNGHAALQQMNTREFYVRLASEALAASVAASAQQAGWDGKCVQGHCGSPSGCEDQGSCRAAPSLTVGDERGLALWQLIYGAIAHEPLPLKVGQIERAAKRVEDMLKRRAAAQAEPVAVKALGAEIAHEHDEALAELAAKAEAQFQADIRDAARYRVLRDKQYSFGPRITDPANVWLTYTPEGLDQACDEMLTFEAGSNPPAQGAEAAHEARREAQRELERYKGLLARARLDLMRELRKQGWTPPAAQAPAAEPLGAVVSAYRIGDGINPIKVERVKQINGPDLWTVRHNYDVLNKQGTWEWEPRPSERDDDFLARCRFATSDEAIAAALAAAKEQQP